MRHIWQLHRHHTARKHQDVACRPSTLPQNMHSTTTACVCFDACTVQFWKLSMSTSDYHAKAGQGGREVVDATRVTGAEGPTEEADAGSATAAGGYGDGQ